MKRPFLIVCVALLVGALAGATIRSAQADTVNEIYRIRVALESIAGSLQGCRK